MVESEGMSLTGVMAQGKIFVYFSLAGSPSERQDMVCMSWVIVREYGRERWVCACVLRSTSREIYLRLSFLFARCVSSVRGDDGSASRVSDTELS